MILGETLFLMILGHCIGDFALQPQKLALNKKSVGKEGNRLCILHCLIYTCAVIGTMLWSNEFRDIIFNLKSYQLLLFFIAIFFTHYIIDRTDLVSCYMDKMDIRSWDNGISKDIWLSDDYLTPREGVTISFGSLVYVVIDNTFHIILMYLTLKLLYGTI